MTCFGVATGIFIYYTIIYAYSVPYSATERVMNRTQEFVVVRTRVSGDIIFRSQFAAAAQSCRLRRRTKTVRAERAAAADAVCCADCRDSTRISGRMMALRYWSLMK